MKVQGGSVGSSGGVSSNVGDSLVKLKQHADSTDIALNGKAPSTTGTSILKANGAGAFTNAVPNLDYVPPSGNIANATATSIAIGEGLNPASVVDIWSVTKGLLIPRMNTTQQNSIATPPNGLMIYNTDSSALVIFKLNAWRIAGSSFSFTYTPTLTNGSNVETSTPFEAMVTVTGEIVTVTGAITIDAVNASSVSFNLSLPIASNFTTSQLYGTGIANESTVRTLYATADAANDNASFGSSAASSAARTYTYSFTYQIF